MALRLTVESTDELGGIGQFGANDLDGDFPPEQPLGRPVDPAERPLPDRWTELVAAELAAVRRQLLSDRYALDVRCSSARSSSDASTPISSCKYRR